MGVVYGRAPANHANPVVRSFFNKQFGYDAIMAKQKREGGRGNVLQSSFVTTWSNLRLDAPFVSLLSTDS